MFNGIIKNKGKIINTSLSILGKISSLLNIYYLLEPCMRAFFKPSLKEIHVDNHILTIFPPVITATLSLLLFFAVDWVRLLTTLMVIP